MKVRLMQPIIGVDQLEVRGPAFGDMDVNYIKQSVVEQREHDLLQQLEVSEDTVETLEGLLKKYAEEVVRLRQYNDALRFLHTQLTQSAPAIPTPPAPSTLPWVWQQPSVVPLHKQPWQFPTQITSIADLGSTQFAINAAKEVDKLLAESLPAGYVDFFKLMEALEGKHQ